jgi:hypothetical protein
MNNRETIEQVERGYRMAQPSHMQYPESKSHPKEVVTAQANVYKVGSLMLPRAFLRLYLVPMSAAR